MISNDPNGDLFRRALEEIGRVPRTGREERGAPPSRGTGLCPCFALAPMDGGGDAARWDLAREWSDEPSALCSPTAPQLKADPAPSDLADAVARELDFRAGLSTEAVTERWRAFVWRNHPDRQPSHAQEQANARVALANALYDRARCALRT